MAFTDGLKMIEKYRLLTQNVQSVSMELMNTLIHFYGELGDIDSAVKVFKMIPDDKKNVVSITAMIKAYNKCEQYDRSMQLYEKIVNSKSLIRLKSQCLSDPQFFCVVLDCYSHYGSFEIGDSILNQVLNEKNLSIRNKMLNNDFFINSLITLYWKCDNIKKAYELFDQFNFDKDNNRPRLVVYQSIMEYQSKSGQAVKCQELFYQIKKLLIANGEWNLKITQNKLINIYTILIDSYGHVGMIDEAKQEFNQMCIDCPNIIFDVGVITSMVTCLGKKSNESLKDAVKFAKKYLAFFKDSPMNQFKILVALLSCCYTHNNLLIGERVFHKIENIIEKNTQDIIDPGSAYRVFSHLLSNCGQHGKAKQIIDGKLMHKS